MNLSKVCATDKWQFVTELLQFRNILVTQKCSFKQQRSENYNSSYGAEKFYILNKSQ